MWRSFSLLCFMFVGWFNDDNNCYGDGRCCYASDAAWWVVIIRSRIYTLNKNGDRIPPCFVPLPMLNEDDTALFHRIQTRWWLYQYANSDTIWAESPISNSCYKCYKWHYCSKDKLVRMSWLHCPQRLCLSAFQ